MTVIEIAIGIAVLIAGGIAFLAHRDGLSFKAEAAKDQQAIKDEFHKVTAELQAKVAVLEHKTTPAATPVAPASPGAS